MENNYSRYFKLTLCVLVFVLSLSFTFDTGYGQQFNGKGRLKAWLAERGIDHTQFRERIREAIQVQNRYKDMLMEKSGVVGSGTGITPEGDPVIKVFTARRGIAGIPESLEGVRVRTKVTGRFYAVQDPPTEPSRTDRWPRPVPIGVSTGHPDITAGTIGARVTDGTSVYALSNNHVYANLNNASLHDEVIQPGTYDGGSLPNDYIGTLSDFERIEFCTSWFGFLLNCPDNQIDAAIAKSSTADLGSATPADGYGAPESTTVSPEVGLSVMKYGRTTGLRYGTIDAINATVNVGYGSQTARFVNQIIVASNTAFIQGGDSGSLLVTDPGRNPVGLLYAGNQSGTSAIANRIDLVLNQFGVTIDSGVPPTLESIAVEPTSATLEIEQARQFTATGYYDGGGTADLTSSVEWASTDESVVTISDSGLATGVGDGTASITATQDDITSDPVTLTVTPHENTYIHVGDLDGESSGRRFWRAKIYITVHNSDHQPVAAAVVVGSFDDCPSGVDCAEFQCTTGSNGRCNVVGYQYWADHLTFTVDSVTHPTLEYNPNLNHDPDGDSNPAGTSIYVPRP